MPDQNFGTLNAITMGTLNYAVVPGAIAGSFVGYLPVLAALVGMCFYLLQIWESKTVQTWLTTWATRRKFKQLVRTKAKVKRREEQLAELHKKLKGLESS